MTGETGPSVELLYWEGCPSHPEALADLRAALAELGRGDLDVAVRRIDDEAQARSEGFVGSPTIRIGGADAFPPGADEPPALACRVYRLADGRYSPTPDPAELRAALGHLLPG
jgi:hypothetical protein